MKRQISYFFKTIVLGYFVLFSVLFQSRNAFTASHADKDTELIIPDDLHIDLLPLLREYFHLDIPINPVCRPDCKGLCPVCGEPLEQSNCNHTDVPSDPRFDVLKKLLDDDTSPSA